MAVLPRQLCLFHLNWESSKYGLVAGGRRLTESSADRRIMGKYDDAMYRYLSDNDRFADLFNAVLFDGRAVVRGELLEDASERRVEVAPDAMPRAGVGGLPRYENSVRDICKRMRTGECFVITTIENQSVIDYAMPPAGHDAFWEGDGGLAGCVS